MVTAVNVPTVINMGVLHYALVWFIFSTDVFRSKSGKLINFDDMVSWSQHAVEGKCNGCAAHTVVNIIMVVRLYAHFFLSFYVFSV